MSRPSNTVKQLDKLKEDSTYPSFLSTEYGNDVIDIINALLKLRIQPGTKNQVHWSRDNVVIEFSSSGSVVATSVGGTTDGMIFKGEYDAEAAYSAQDVVVIRTGANAGSYVCIENSPANSPVFPDSGTSWVSLGRGDVVGSWL